METFLSGAPTRVTIATVAKTLDAALSTFLGRTSPP